MASSASASRVSARKMEKTNPVTSFFLGMPAPRRKCENEYNPRMPRAALFALLVASILSGVLQAQRAGGAFHGNAAGPHVRSGFIAQHGSQVARRSPFLPSSHRQLNN